LKKLFFKVNLRWIAILPIVFGLILIEGAFYYREMFYLSLVIGILGLIKGSYLVFGPSTQIKSINEWWFNQASEGTIRLFGLITFILGSAILSHLI